MRFISDTHIDGFLAGILDPADEIAVCSQQPETYFNACWPDMWQPDTETSAGDLVRPPTGSGFIYECTSAGTTGSTEPPWAEAQDAVFSDNTVSWKTHENHSLINAPVNTEDKTITHYEQDGRQAKIAEKMGILVHTDGTVTHTALISNTNREIQYITTGETTIESNNHVLSGRTTLIHELVLVVKYPSELV